jgi:hypothetical protein
MENPAYSPELEANNYHSSREKAKCWLTHHDDYKVEKNATQWLITLGTDFYQQKIEKLIPQYDVLLKHVQG